jgi:hypothetical protein
MDSFYTSSAREQIGAPPSIAPTVPPAAAGYDADAARFLPLLTPKLTKSGTVAVRQPHIPKQSADWWRSQCSLRGLPSTGKIELLQQRIREHGDKGMEKSLREACEKMTREFEETNKATLGKIWGSADNNEKAKVWTKAFLYENFVLPPKAKKKTVVVEVDDWAEKMEQACREMNIFCEERKMNKHRTGQRLVVAGLDQLAVRSKMAELSQDEIRAAARAREEAEAKQQAAEKEYQRTLKLAKSKGRQSKGPWDVAGGWSIDCSRIEGEWGYRGQKCSLDIEFTKPTKDGRAQMFALFDFIVFQGIMRFVDSQSADVDENEDEDEDDEDDDDDENDDGDESESFFFPSSSLPSSNNREFDYRWRGEDTGTGEIQLGSNRELCSVTFHSPNALSGTFTGPAVGECEFTGIKKTGRPRKGERNGGSSDPEHAWRSRSREAYDEANRRRWR